MNKALEFVKKNVRVSIAVTVCGIGLVLGVSQRGCSVAPVQEIAPVVAPAEPPAIPAMP